MVISLSFVVVLAVVVSVHIWNGLQDASLSPEERREEVEAIDDDLRCW